MGASREPAVGGGGDTQPQTDVVARAKAALEGITPGPWEAIHHWHDTSYPSDTWHVITELTGDLVAEVDDESRGYEEPHGEFGRDATFIAAARSLVPELVAEVEKLRAVAARERRLSGQANYLLARIVAAANLGAVDGKDGFIESYNLPVGPIHKAIPFLHEQGIVVTYDGQIKNGPEEAVGPRVDGSTPK